MKKIQVVDMESGHVEVSEEVKGYHLIFPRRADTTMKIVKHLDMGMLTPTKVIKTHYYAPVIARIIDKYVSTLKHLQDRQHLIMHVQDTASKGNKKQPNPVEIKKVNSFASDFLGYSYLMEFKSYYIDKMSQNQLLVHIYRELLRIHPDGSILKPTEKLMGHIPHTLGRDWDTTQAEISNILDHNFEWRFPPKLIDQLSIYDMAEKVEEEEKEIEVE
ncbi:putative metallopeptidase [Anaerosolibacter sp.]|uniref:putative metallopeptidase n=1 Tax=Anaerosolibacter sp. TaxID=1872527 RepID=UPI0039F0EF9F